jgi:hypothetical protein
MEKDLADFRRMADLRSYHDPTPVRFSFQNGDKLRVDREIDYFKLPHQAQETVMVDYQIRLEENKEFYDKYGYPKTQYYHPTYLGTGMKTGERWLVYLPRYWYEGRGPRKPPKDVPRGKFPKDVPRGKFPKDIPRGKPRIRRRPPPPEPEEYEDDEVEEQEQEQEQYEQDYYEVDTRPDSQRTQPMIELQQQQQQALSTTMPTTSDPILFKDAEYEDPELTKEMEDMKKRLQESEEQVEKLVNPPVETRTEVSFAPPSPFVLPPGLKPGEAHKAKAHPIDLEMLAKTMNERMKNQGSPVPPSVYMLPGFESIAERNARAQRNELSIFQKMNEKKKKELAFDKKQREIRELFTRRKKK